MVSHLKTGAQTLKIRAADGVTPQNRCPHLKILELLMVPHLKTGAQTLKFRTADGLAPQNRCPNPEISDC